MVGGRGHGLPLPVKIGPTFIEISDLRAGGRELSRWDDTQKPKEDKGRRKQGHCTSTVCSQGQCFPHGVSFNACRDPARLP